jgi:hypothetical protein
MPSSKVLRAGCYLLRYLPLSPVDGTDPLSSLVSHYDGTFRVHRADDRVTASGDLYFHERPSEDPSDPLWFEPDPNAGIPIFPIAAYRYHLRVVSLRPKGSHLRLRFEVTEYHHADKRWENVGCFWSRLRWSLGPRAYPAPEDFLAGDVRDCAGAVVGFVTMGWISTALRRAVVEIDQVPPSEMPLNDGGSLDWRTVFAGLPWDVTVIPGETTVSEPSLGSWSDAELHAAMLESRDPSTDLDREWRVHLLCVRRVDKNERGVMYDAGSADSDHVPREGAAIASHWEIPNADPWGKVRGLRFGQAHAPYLRAAVHEVSHAFSLGHDPRGTHIMRPTEDIAKEAPRDFPDNVAWSFSPEHAFILRHASDLVVRPGGVVAFQAPPLDREGRRPDGLRFELSALLDNVPWGAPVRVHAMLRNTGKNAVLAPASLGLRAGFVRGRVYDAKRVAREFRPLVLCADGQSLAELAPGGAIESSFTLLRGPQGALFPAPGAYRVAVRADWPDGDQMAGVRAECTVTVTGPTDAEHAAAARAVLDSPDALLTLVLGGDHLQDGLAAIRAAMANKTLRPHFAAVEARRLGRAFRDRPADFGAVRALLDESAVVTPSEIRRLSLLAQDGSADQAEARAEVLRALRARAAT